MRVKSEMAEDMEHRIRGRRIADTLEDANLEKRLTDGK